MGGSDEYDFDYLRFRAVGFAAIVLVLSFIYCVFDLLFLVFSGQTIATVTDIYSEASASRRRGPQTIVEWKFTTPSGEERMGKTSASGVSKGDQIIVQYLPGWLLKSWDSSRPVRPFNWIALSIFFAAALGTGFFGYSAIFQAEKPQAPRRR